MQTKPQVLMLATDIFVFSTAPRENAIRNASSKLVLLNVNDS